MDVIMIVWVGFGIVGDFYMECGVWDRIVLIVRRRFMV